MRTHTLESRLSTKVVSWNIDTKHEPWRQPVNMEADVALLQEVGSMPTDVADMVDTGPVEHWDSRWFDGSNVRDVDYIDYH